VLRRLVPGSLPGSSRLHRILIAYTVNRLGSWVGLVALSLAVFDHTNSALAVAGLLLAWQALPAFLVPAVVARVEASRSSFKLSALYLFEALATLVLVWLSQNFWLPGVLVMAVLDGTAALAASALLRAEVARVARAEADALGGDLPKEDREERAHEAERKANASVNVAFSVSFVAGPLIGGAISAGAGVAVALLIDVVSFVICAGLLLDLNPHVEEAAGSSVGQRLQAGLLHINETPFLRSLLIAEAVALTFIQAGSPVEVAYAKDTLSAGDGGYGLLVAAWGGGSVLASILFARKLRWPLTVVLVTGLFALSAAFIGLSVAPSLAVACAAAVLGGIGNGLEWPSLISLVQRLSPQHLRGRMMGVVESLAALTLAIGLPLGGLLVALISARAAFLIVGIGAGVSTAVFARLTLIGTPHKELLAGATAAGGPPDEQHVEELGLDPIPE
jgi:MFS family permease